MPAFGTTTRIYARVHFNAGMGRTVLGFSKMFLTPRPGRWCCRTRWLSEAQSRPSAGSALAVSVTDAHARPPQIGRSACLRSCRGRSAALAAQRHWLPGGGRVRQPSYRPVLDPPTAELPPRCARNAPQRRPAAAVVPKNSALPNMGGHFPAPSGVPRIRPRRVRGASRPVGGVRKMGGRAGNGGATKALVGGVQYAKRDKR